MLQIQNCHTSMQCPPPRTQGLCCCLHRVWLCVLVSVPAAHLHPTQPSWLWGTSSSVITPGTSAPRGSLSRLGLGEPMINLGTGAQESTGQLVRFLNAVGRWRPEVPEQWVKSKVKENSPGITWSSAGKRKKFPTVILGMHLASVS